MGYTRRFEQPRPRRRAIHPRKLTQQMTALHTKEQLFLRSRPLPLDEATQPPGRSKVPAALVGRARARPGCTMRACTAGCCGRRPCCPRLALPCHRCRPSGPCQSPQGRCRRPPGSPRQQGLPLWRHLHARMHLLRPRRMRCLRGLAMGPGCGWGRGRPARGACAPPSGTGAARARAGAGAGGQPVQVHHYCGTC